MSQLEVDKIIPQSGTTLTIGETGDTISFASGVLPSLESLTITGDLTVDTNTLYVDSTNNNVGIGTTSPTVISATGTTLDVVGDAGGFLRIERTNATNPSEGMFRALNGEIRLGAVTNSVLTFRTNNAEAMRIDSSGFVGIGTSSPSTILDIQGADAASSRINVLRTGGSDVGAQLLSTGSVGGIGATNSGPFSFFTSDTEQMRIDSSGNVGIGTTSPSGLLEVAGEIIADDNGSNDGGAVIRAWNTGSPYAMFGTANMALGSEYAVLTNGTNTYIAGGAGGSVFIRNGANDSSPQIQVGPSQIEMDGLLVTASGGGFTTVTGNYGNIQVDGGGTIGGYDGLNINGHTVFMSNGSTAGIYNDTNNEWLLFGQHNGAVALYYNGSNKLQTKSDGVNISGEIEATSLDINGAGNISGDITFATSYLTSINSAGLYVGTSSSDLNDANDNGAVILDATGSGFRLRVAGNNSTQGPMYVNRSTADNAARDLINFYRNGAAPGYIRATNTLVTYQTFCGAHASQFSDYRRDETIKEGTVMESIDELCSWYMAEFTKPVAEYTDKEGVFHPATTKTVRRYITHEGHTLGQSITYTDEDGVDYPATVVLEAEEEHLPKCKISDTVESKGVYGVFHANEHDDTEMNGGDMSIASLGAYKVRINANETVQIGDYLQSNGDGTAKVQADDIFRASTIAKVTSTQVLDSYDDGSYTVPCTLHCG